LHRFRSCTSRSRCCAVACLAVGAVRAEERASATTSATAPPPPPPPPAPPLPAAAPVHLCRLTFGQRSLCPRGCRLGERPSCPAVPPAGACLRRPLGNGLGLGSLHGSRQGGRALERAWKVARRALAPRLGLTLNRCCFFFGQRTRKAVLADFHTQHTLGDAGALLAAPQGRPGAWEAVLVNPGTGARAPRGLMLGAPRGASGAGAPRVRGQPIRMTDCRRMRAAAALKVHASPGSGSGRLVFALRGRRGEGRTDVFLMAASSSVISALLLSRRPSARVRDGGARQCGCVGSRHSACDGVARPHQRIYTYGPPALVMCWVWGAIGRFFYFIFHNTHAHIDSAHVQYSARAEEVDPLSGVGGISRFAFLK